MEVKTVYGIMDIHIGAIFAEVYGSISRLGGSYNMGGN